MKSPWQRWEHCPNCRNKEFLFEPYPLRNPHGMALLRIYHRGPTHLHCVGKCGSNSNCPYCNGSQEIGWLICKKCRFVYEGIRMRSGKVFISQDTNNADPVYVPQFNPSAICLN